MNGGILVLFTNLISSELPFIFKGISAIVIIAVFMYHLLISTTEEFQAKYPGLYQNLDKNKYLFSMVAIIVVPYGAVLFLIMLIINKHDTRVFLKTFGTKRKTRKR